MKNRYAGADWLKHAHGKKMSKFGELAARFPWNGISRATPLANR